MDCGTIDNRLITVDALVGLFADGKVGNKFEQYEDTSGTTDQDDFMDVRLVYQRTFPTGVPRTISWQRPQSSSIRARVKEVEHFRKLNS